MRIAIPSLVAVGLLLLAGAATAQTALNRNAPVNPAAPLPGSPVDTNVADADPLSVSFRRVEPGNAQFSFAARLTVADFGHRWTARHDPATGLRHDQGYHYRAPGVRALIDRPTYLTRTPGGIQINVQPDGNNRAIAIVPANTVYLLTPERTPRPDAAVAAPPPANWLDARIDGRPNLQRSAAPPAAAKPRAAPVMNADAFLPRLNLESPTSHDPAEWTDEGP